ncbi:transposon-transfer assisting family protein [Hominisplanchenecus murintestinalis]|uniref:transposon-transfer assisting family protein n=1 Tax=Hominisplanchenecus murintestinalis TaxID=2941517 RepID=UPI00203E0AD2|nr:transposon-transfer assisting family protein [Hominisplanchenecus murintestinalis]
MGNFTFDEMNLMCIYNTGTREGLINALKEMRGYLEPDEAELLALTDSTLEKLSFMGDMEFEALELYPDFDDKEDEDGE